MSETTITAIATPPGRGGVGIIRISGPEAYSIALKLINSKKLEVAQVHYCSFKDRQHTVIDQGLVLYFKAPNSFTGEDVVEFQCHGSPIVLDYLLSEIVALGARLARPGEFSERAFLNDKIDLTQAEAIADLIHSSSQTAARLAMRSLQGEFSKRISSFNEELIKLRLFVEAAIDFPEEEIDFLTEGRVKTKLENLVLTLSTLRANASQGALLREGISIVIAGRPNAGKSTLINSLAGREVAIVTEVPGTTRDVMREHILLDELPLHLIDTAGLRETSDIVEIEGIKRAWQELKGADCVLLISDLSVGEEKSELIAALRQVLPPAVPIIEIFNKIDALGLLPKVEGEKIYLSAKTTSGLDLLKTKIKRLVGYQANEGQFLARRRHLEALDKAHNFLILGQEQLEKHAAGELLAEDLRLAHQVLCEITGEFSSDDLLGKIFSSFCIGK